MKFSIRYADQVVGTLVIVAIAIVLFVVFMLGTSQRWFKRDVQYKTYVSSAAGIGGSMPVQYKGFNIGQVKKISLAENNSVEVLFIIFEEHIKKVKDGSVVEIAISPIGLGGSFNFYPGKGKNEIPAGMMIPEMSSKEAKDIIAKGWTEIPDSAGDGINAIFTQVTTLLETINASLGSKEEGEDPPLSLILYNISKLTEDISDRVGPILGDLESLTNQVADPSGTIMSLLDGEGALNVSLARTLVSIAGIIEELEKVVEFVPAQLPQIGVLISRLNTTMNQVQDVLQAVANNPLLRGGVPERKESGPGGSSPRNETF